MADGRIRRSARRGVAAAVLGWLCVATASVVLAPGASAAESVTVTIDDVTPPLASVDAGGRVTFVNAIKADTVSVSVPSIGVLPAQKASATVYRDVAVTFFGEQRTLATGRSTSWTFPQTTNGSITYTFRIVPQSGLAAPVAGQVVSLVRATLDDDGAPVTVPYVVQTVLPDLPNVPSVGVPELPAIEVPDPPGGEPPVDDPTDLTDGDDTPGGPGGGGGSDDDPEPIDGTVYTYGNGASPQMKAVDSAAARAFDPSRFTPFAGSADAASRRSGAGGGGGVAGAYDGALVPVFGQLAGVDGASLDDQVAGEQMRATAQALPASALAAVIALATVIAALVQTSVASCRSRD